MSPIIKHCPICNRPSDEVRFVGEFCEHCVAEKVRGTIPDHATISQCRGCMRVLTKEGHVPLDNDSMAAAIWASLHNNKCKVEVTGFNDIGAESNITLETEYGSVRFEKKIKVKRTHEMCTECFRMRSGYYEAIVQLRGNPQRIDSMIGKLTRYLEKRNTLITKAESVNNGVDIYTTDKLVTSEFMKDYELKPTRSYTLYGLKHGNKLYRNTYLLRL